MGREERDGHEFRSAYRTAAQLHASARARLGPIGGIIAQVAQRLGFAREFAFSSAAQIFDEHARLSAANNAATRAFDIGGLAGLTEQEYDNLEPTPWPVPAAP